MPGEFSRRKLLKTGLALGGGLLVPGHLILGASDSATGAGDESSTDLLIVGAGPFGLALSAYAQKHGIRHRVAGEPMSFWRENMPRGMYLRSTCDWSLDPLGVHSIDAYLDTLGKRCADVEPLSRDFYLDYAEWFQVEKAITSDPAVITISGSRNPDASTRYSVADNGVGFDMTYVGKLFQVFQRLAQHFQHVSRELDEFVEKQHAPVRQRDFSRSGVRAAARQARLGGRVVR